MNESDLRRKTLKLRKRERDRRHEMVGSVCSSRDKNQKQTNKKKGKKMYIKCNMTQACKIHYLMNKHPGQGSK